MCKVFASVDFTNYERFVQEDAIFISQHAYKRMKERLGWNKKTSERMMKKVYDTGKRDNDLKGYLAVWLKKKHMFMDNDDVVIFGEHIFLFRNRVLVTVLHSPGRVSCLKAA